MSSRSDFNAKTSGQTVADAFSSEISAKIVLITGVSPNGLGAELAQILAAHSPSLLILAGRSQTKVQAAMNQISQAFPSVPIRFLSLDVSSLASVRSAAAEVNAYLEPHIDVLINNAGVMNIPTRTLSVDGIEMHLATNYLGPFHFTNLIMKKLAAAKTPRVVNVASNGYAISPFRFSDWNFDDERNLPLDEAPIREVCTGFGIPWGKGYLPPVAYGQSKTASVLHALALSKKLEVAAFSVHPGAIQTDLWREMDKEAVAQIFQAIPMKTASQGVATAIVAAFDPKLQAASGAYLNDCQVESVAPFAADEDIADKLWMKSEEIIKQNLRA